jgi:enoyl-CoA hydratase/carnithine racemase
MSFETLETSLDGGVAHVRLNRPQKANALNRAMWDEIRRAFRWVDDTPAARVAVLSGAGPHFCSGIDLALLASVQQVVADPCPGRAREALRRFVLDLQDTVTSLERCRKPVLAAIHGACIGGAVDLVCCADVRYASADASFQVKEIDIGMTADVGTLQRLPHLVGDGLARELAYTGRAVGAAEAREMRLVNRVFDTREALVAGVAEVAATIAAKSPLAVRGTKEMLLYARDHTVSDGLDHVATWNAAMLMSADLEEAMGAAMGRRTAAFRD